MSLKDFTSVTMTDYAKGRHFGNPKFAGTKITDIESADFLDNMKVALTPEGTPSSSAFVTDGYAPFCKLVFIRNFTNAENPVCEIADDNRHLLQSGYKLREGALPGEVRYLARWMPQVEWENYFSSVAPWLMVILYNKEALAGDKIVIEEDWGIVSINAVTTPEEQPMAPETMLRNALGSDFGGSGVDLNREEYEKACEFWSNHALIK